MNVYWLLRAALFFYECFRILLLASFLFITPPESSIFTGSAGVFPSVVFLGAGALFPLMTLFVWLEPEKNRNYLSLYIAGRIISVVLFCVWEIFSARPVPETIVKNISLSGRGGVLNLADVFSVWGAWVLKNKLRSLPGVGGGTEREV